MGLFERFSALIEYIEDNLTTEINQQRMAQIAQMSIYNAQKMFSIIFNISLGEYIRRRKLTVSINDLQSSDKSIIDVALRYGYSSPEGYTRAFKAMFNITPSEAKKNHTTPKMFPPISVKDFYERKFSKMNDLKQRGYSVINNGAIYYTLDMDKSKNWFEKTLGWFAGIDERDSNNIGVYGCVTPFPSELVTLNIAPFNGFHMYYGKPSKQTVMFTNVNNIRALRQYVLNSGWAKITDVHKQPYEAYTCDLTTIDGSIIRFCEVIK